MNSTGNWVRSLTDLQLVLQSRSNWKYKKSQVCGMDITSEYPLLQATIIKEMERRLIANRGKK